MSRLWSTKQCWTTYIKWHMTMFRFLPIDIDREHGKRQAIEWSWPQSPILRNHELPSSLLAACLSPPERIIIGQSPDEGHLSLKLLVVSAINPQSTLLLSPILHATGPSPIFIQSTCIQGLLTWVKSSSAHLVLVFF